MCVSDDGDIIYKDASDLVYPSHESNAFFLATKFTITQNQTQGWCQSPFFKYDCKNNGECNINNPPNNGRCNLNTNKCEYRQWCPEEDEYTKGQNVTKIYKTLGVNNFTIWIKAMINFPLLAPLRTFSTILDPNPVPRSVDPVKGNLFNLDEILELTNSLEYGPSMNTSYESIRERGAIIKMSIQWYCDLEFWRRGNPCDITYKAIRLDNHTNKDGFNFRYSDFYKMNYGNGVVNVRDLNKFYGVRVIIESSGVGSQISVVNILLQLSSGLAMLAISTLICDLLVQYVFPYKIFKVRDVEKGAKRRRLDLDKLDKIDGNDKIDTLPENPDKLEKRPIVADTF